MSTYVLSTAHLPQRRFQIHHKPWRQPFQWLEDGWGDLRAAPVISLVHGLIIGLLVAALGRWLGASEPFYLVPFAFGGFLIIAPVLALSLLALAKQREDGLGEDATKPPLSALALLSRNASALGLFGLFLLLVFINWVMLSNLLFGGVFHELMPTYEQVRPLPVMFAESWPFALVFGGLALILAALVFRASALALPLMVDHKIDPFNAAFASWRAVGENAASMALWALLLALLTGLGLLTFGLGFIVLMPWMANASWHGYRDIIRLQAGEDGNQQRASEPS
jgi:uncharacterized membrane protein